MVGELVLTARLAQDKRGKMMDSGNGVTWRQETWLRTTDGLRRPMTRETISQQEYDKQRRQEVVYTVYEWTQCTYSDGQGGRGNWRRT